MTDNKGGNYTRSNNNNKVGRPWLLDYHKPIPVVASL